MRSRAPRALVFGAGVTLVLLAPLPASQAGKPPRGARVAVVAYHDSRLLTLCPVIGKEVIESSILTSQMRARVAVNYPPIGGQSIAFMQVDEIGTLARVFLPMPAGRPSAVGPGDPASRAAPADLDRLARDRDVERRLIDRFRARKTYAVTDDPSEADFVFVAESTYVALSGGVADPPSSSSRLSSKTASDRRRDAPERIFSDTESEWRRRMDWSADPGHAAGPPSPPPPAPIGSFILGGDRPLNWRQSILAIAVPGALYREHARDGSALSAGRTWNGLVAAATTSSRTAPGQAPATTMKGASPEDLVDRFHARGQGLPDYLPVCAATSGAIASIHDPVETVPATPVGAVPPVSPSDVTGSPTRTAVAGHDAASLFRSNVTLVTVPVTVTDRSGAIVADLPVSSFHVFEDDVEQKVERLERGAIATDMVLMIDTSAGMRAPRESIRSSAAGFAQALRVADRAMVVKFANRVQVHSELTGDRAALQAALSATGPGGSTRLYDALALVAADRLASMEGRKAVVLFTDGRDTQSQLTNEDGALAAMEAIGAPVYVVRYETPDASSFIPAGAFGIRRWLIPFSNPGAEDEARAAADAFLVRLVSGTGGQLFAAQADAQVPEIIAHIAETLSSQLVLRYYPSKDRLDGTYRRIRVGVDCEGCTVRARPGYRAGVLE